MNKAGQSVERSLGRSLDRAQSLPGQPSAGGLLREGPGQCLAATATAPGKRPEALLCQGPAGLRCGYNITHIVVHSEVRERRPSV